jgi:hypothetical protein
MTTIGTTNANAENKTAASVHATALHAVVVRSRDRVKETGPPQTFDMLSRMSTLHS